MAGDCGGQLALLSGWAILGLASAGGFPVAAQEPDAPAPTNDVTAAEVLSQLNDLVQAADSAPARGHGSAQRSGSDQRSPAGRCPGSRAGTAPTGLTASTTPADLRMTIAGLAGGVRPGQGPTSPGFGSANDYSRGGDRSQTNSLAGTNNGPATLDYAAFKVIVDRNIFDPNRYPAPGRAAARSPDAQERRFPDAGRDHEL